ncbi:MAG: YhbY family RNA-binding protein [Betaproteobacteria bacterium]|nr:YhbY family RNA-binding protein [Betaproteobacteria bacterium]
MKITLSPSERRALRARAHALEPVVMIGDQGLTSAVIRESERSLKAHELIKIRAAGEREDREKWLEELANALHAAPVQHIGKMLVLWRENPDLAKARAKALQPPPKKKTPRLTRQQEEAMASRTTRRRTKSK